MIKKVHIAGYKSHRDITLDNLKRFVLIGGDNSVGKTNLLEALFLQYDLQNPSSILRHWSWRGLPHIPTDAEHFYGTLFSDLDSTATITVETEGTDGTVSSAKLSVSPHTASLVADVGGGAPSGTEAEVSTEAPPSRPRPLDIVLKHGGKEARGSLSFRPGESGSMQAQIKYDINLSRPRNIMFLTTRGGMSAQEEASRFGEYVEKRNLVPEAVRLVKLVSEQVADLASVPFPQASVVLCDAGLAQKVPLRLLGDGASRVLQFLCAILYAQGSLALFDEVDSGFHYTKKVPVLRSIAEASREYDCQVFATTHSYECIESALEAFKGEFEDDFCYVRLERERGAVVPKYYSYDGLAVALENNWEVR